MPDWLLRLAGRVFPSVLFRAETTERVLALTIDDGPHPAVTPELLRVLRDHEVSATFFVLGRNAQAHPALLDSIRAGGHEIGNHFFTDRPTVTLSEREMRDELSRTDALLGLGDSPRWCRPGSGWITPGLVRRIESAGYRTCLGTAPPLDVYLSASRTEAYLLANVRPGAILVLHDGGPDRVKTVGVVERLLSRLREEGWEFVTVTDLVEGDSPATRESAP